MKSILRLAPLPMAVFAALFTSAGQGQTADDQGHQPQTADNPEAITGQCHCGKVRYTAKPPILDCTECSCEACRHTTGALQAQFLIVNRDSFQVIAGELSTAVVPEPHVHCDAHGDYKFCAHCGTPIVWMPHKGKRAEILAGTLDNPSLWRKPEPEAKADQTHVLETPANSVCEKSIARFHEVTRSNGHQCSIYQRSQIWALETVLIAMGIDSPDYGDLMVAGGWAGQFVYQANPDWITFIEPFPDAIPRACEAFGIRCAMKKAETAEDAFSWLVENLREDRPVIAEWLEYGFFAGLRENGNGEPRVLFLNMPFHKDGAWWTREEFTETFWNQHGGKRFFVITGRCEPKDPKAVLQQALEDLVLLAEGEYWTGWKKDAAPNALTGFAAMEKYAADLADVSLTMQSHDDSNKGSFFFERGWGCYAAYPQWTARECIAQYLRRSAELCNASAAEHLYQAASHYHQTYLCWREWEKHIGRKATFQQEQASDDSGFKPEVYDAAWANPETREAGSQRVLEALEHERQAIAEIKLVRAALAQ